MSARASEEPPIKEQDPRSGIHLKPDGKNKGFYRVCACAGEGVEILGTMSTSVPTGDRGKDPP